MAGASHPASRLAEFQDGETRLLYARHISDPTGPLYYLADGTAEQIRSWALTHLECFLPECDSRALKVVSRHRSGRRDGFSHHSGAGGHSKESLFHQQGKALIARWVTDTYPEVTATLEQATEAGTRRADVMLTWPDRRQVAVEVQYAPLSVADWQARHDSYAEQGIVDVWLLGHRPPHLRTAPTSEVLPGEDEVTLTALHHAMLAAGTSVLWLNPLHEQIATPWTVGHAVSYNLESSNTQLPVPPQPHRRYAHVDIAALTSCTLDPDRGVQHPRAADLRANAAELEQINRDRAAEHQQRTAQRDQARARAGQADAAQARAAAAYLQAWHEQLPTWESAWAQDPLRQKIIDHYTTIPAVLADPCTAEEGIWASPQRWRAIVYETIAARTPRGPTITAVTLLETLRRRDIAVDRAPDGLAFKALDAYLRRLRAANIVTLGFSRRTGLVANVTPHMTIAQAAAAHEAWVARTARSALTPAQRAERDAAAAQRLVDDARARVARNPGPPLRRAHATPTATPRPGRPVCRVCGTALDPQLADRGRHLLC